MIESENKTPAGQRVVIFFIAVLMLVSTLALYAMVIVSDKNTRTDEAELQSVQDQFSELLSQHDVKMEAQRLELSSRYFDTFSPFKSEVRAFNATAVTELVTRDLVIGDGAEMVEGSSDYAAFYIGWLADETIFDSSLGTDSSLKNPLPGGSMIDGWDQGIIGMKIGGVREITIPAELAYGETARGEEGSSSYIPANSPLKFIVMLIDRPEDIPFPAGTIDLCVKLYTDQYGEEMAQYYCEMYYDEGF